ncbi:MAG: hypothetical protein HHAS10_02560 [Candidatus Altimarinota bacterium]
MSGIEGGSLGATPDSQLRDVLIQAFPQMRDIDSKVRDLPQDVRGRILDLMCTGPFREADISLTASEEVLSAVRQAYMNHLRSPAHGQ